MLLWLAENIGTIVICLLLAGIITFIIAGMAKKKKQGKSSCGCGCGGCPMNGECHSKK